MACKYCNQQHAANTCTSQAAIDDRAAMKARAAARLMAYRNPHMANRPGGSKAANAGGGGGGGAAATGAVGAWLTLANTVLIATNAIPSANLLGPQHEVAGSADAHAQADAEERLQKVISAATSSGYVGVPIDGLYVAEIAQHVAVHRAGNCQEKACFAAFRFMELAAQAEVPAPVNLIEFIDDVDGNNHIAVLIGDLASGVICDPWVGIACPAARYRADFTERMRSMQTAGIRVAARDGPATGPGIYAERLFLNSPNIYDVTG